MDDVAHSPELNRAGRRAEARKARLRKAGAALATVPAALGTTALVLGATAGPAGAAPLLVTNLDPSGAASLHDVAEGAADGDVITFQAGLTGTITLADTINIDNKSLTIQGPGAGVVSVSGNDTVQIFDIDGNGGATTLVTISGLTLTHGKISGKGGAIGVESSDLTVADAVLTTNSATSGGGAIAVPYQDGPEDDDIDLRIERSQISGNSARWGGAFYFYSDGGSVTIVDSTISGNHAVEGGGAAWIGGGDNDTVGDEVRVEITGSTLSDNTADGEDGGALFIDTSSAITISGSAFSGNTATNDGGGALRLDESEGSVLITGSTLTGNSAGGGYGGAIYGKLSEGPTTIAFSTIADNTADGSGGGIEWYLNEGELLIESSTLSGNTAAVRGGALYAGTDYAGISIVNSTISGNTADEMGGAVHLSSYYGLAILQSTITGNSAAAIGGVSIYDPSLHETSAQRAVHAEDGERPGNGTGSSDAPARGQAESFAPVTSNGSIIWGNANGDVGIDSSLLATSSILGTVTGTTLVDQGGNQLGVDPLLGPLQNNGGPTQTHELLPGSPAINAGPNPLTPFPGSDFDQRGDGYARVVAGVVDVGAYEVQPVQIEPTFTG